METMQPYILGWLVPTILATYQFADHRAVHSVMKCIAVCADYEVFVEVFHSSPLRSAHEQKSFDSFRYMFFSSLYIAQNSLLNF